MKICINYLPYRRYHYSSFLVDFLIKIKEENKKEILFRCHLEKNDTVLKSNMDKLKENGIIVELLFYPYGFNYQKKYANFCNHECEYSCKLDEDIFLNNYLWDYIIENINVLDNEDNFLIAPSLSTGIPTIDYFIEDHFDEKYKKEIFDSFLKTKFLANHWGVNYSPLNKYTTETNIWNQDNFYKGVEELNCARKYFKGIHPIRISRESTIIMHNFLLDNCGKFLEKKEYSFFEINMPYLCNSFFFIKTDLWEEMFRRKDLFLDMFDEVPLNLLREEKKTKMLGIKNSFAIHNVYNTISSDFDNVDRQFFDNYYGKMK